MISLKLPEVRLVGAVLAFELSKSMVTTGMWIFQPGSMIGKIASLSSSPEIFAYLWMSLALLVLPYMAMQVVGRAHPQQRNVTRLACWAILTSGVFWVYLAFLSRGLDFGSITEIFLFNGSTCVATAALLAYSLNTHNRIKEDVA